MGPLSACSSTVLDLTLVHLHCKGIQAFRHGTAVRKLLPAFCRFFACTRNSLTSHCHPPAFADRWAGLRTLRDSYLQPSAVSKPFSPHDYRHLLTWLWKGTTSCSALASSVSRWPAISDHASVEDVMTVTAWLLNV